MTIQIILALVLLCGGACLGLGKPENVLVVRNTNSAVSVSVAAYYVAARGIPAANVVSISTVDSSLSSANEIITYATYQSQIYTPIRNYLISHGLKNTIQYIVLTKGIPHRLSAEVTGGSTGGQSVDSMLATMDLVNPLRLRFENESHVLLGSPYANRYWRSEAPFSHSVYGGYLVTRLDGYTEADAKALVDRATAPCVAPLKTLLDANSAPTPEIIAAQPESLLLPDGSINPTYQLKLADYDGDIIKASQVISDRAFLNVAIDQTYPLIGSPVPITCYISWGSNGGGNWTTIYPSLTFAGRSIAETAVSSSGRTFLPTTGGQSLIADLISHGVAGAKCYVTEPFLDAMASPTILFDEYTSGRNLAESFYSASRLLGWKDVVLGDPLCTLDLAGGAMGKGRALPDKSPVTVTGVVTTGTNEFAGFIYVQDASLPLGIRVQLAAGQPALTAGATVTVRGILSTTTEKERVITNAQVL